MFFVVGAAAAGAAAADIGIEDSLGVALCHRFLYGGHHLQVKG